MDRNFTATIAFALAACIPAHSAGQKAKTSKPVSATAPRAEAAKEKRMLSVTETTGLPAELRGVLPLWEVVNGASSAIPMAALRVYPDGRMFRYSNNRRIEKDNGLPTRVQAPYAWRLDAKLSAEGLREINAILAAPEFESLAGSFGRPARDAPIMVYRGLVHGKQKAVEQVGVATGIFPKPIETISKLVETSVDPDAAPMNN